MVQNTRKLVGVILMLAMLVAAIAALTVTTSAADTEKWVKTDIADIKSDDVVLITWTKSGKTYAVSNNNGTSKGPAPTEVTVTDDTINGAIADSLKWNITNVNGKLTIYPNGDTTKWLYCTATNNGVRVGTNANKSFVIDSSSGYLKNEATNRYLGVYNTQDVRCYTSSTTTNIANQTLAFYVLQTDSSEPECTHANAKDVEAIAATCTEVGYTAGVYCSDCEEYISGHEAIEALGHTGGTATCEKLAVCDTCGEEYGDLAAHNYVNNVCTECGAEVPSEATIDFSTTSQRLSWTAEIQVWQNGALKVTNNKASSSSNIIDSSNPVRFYKSSNVVIEFPGMTEIVFACNTEAYATALSNSINTATATASVDGTTVTITLNAASDSYTISLSGGQVRVDSITASAPKAGECQHDWDEGVVTTEPTCTVAGVMTYTCTKCGDEKEATIDKAAHNYADTNWCSACNYPKPGIALSIPEAKSLAEYLNGADSGNDKYYMTVFITDVYNTQYGNMNVTDNMGNTFVIYGTYDGNGNRYDAMENAPVAGDLITVYGKIGSYQGTAQMMYADITAVHTVETSDYVEFLGAGMRYLDAEGNTVSTDTVALRFGYQLSDDVLAWGWEFTAGSKAGSMTGENKTADGISNLLFTNIAPENFNTDINVRIWYSININGSIVTIYDEVWNARSVAEVVVKTSQNAADAANAYATQLVTTHNITWTPKEEESTLPEEN